MVPVKNAAVEKLLKDRGTAVENARSQTYFFDERRENLAVALC